MCLYNENSELKFTKTFNENLELKFAKKNNCTQDYKIKQIGHKNRQLLDIALEKNIRPSACADKHPYFMHLKFQDDGSFQIIPNANQLFSLYSKRLLTLRCI